jgi:hypothetical protein
MSLPGGTRYVNFCSVRGTSGLPRQSLADLYPKLVSLASFTTIHKGRRGIVSLRSRLELAAGIGQGLEDTIKVIADDYLKTPKCRSYNCSGLCSRILLSSARAVQLSVEMSSESLPSHTVSALRRPILPTRNTFVRSIVVSIGAQLKLELQSVAR